MRGFLAVFLFISICAIVAASIKDFVIESEDDLRRLGQSNEGSLVQQNDEFYDESDLMMYDGCDNTAAASHSDIYNFMTGIADRDDDHDYDRNEAGDDVDAADSAISLHSVMQNGQLNVQLLQRAIRKLSNDPRFAAIFEHAHLHNGIPSEINVQDYSGCQSPLDTEVDMFYNADLIE